MKKFPAHGILEVTALEKQFRVNTQMTLESSLDRVRMRIKAVGRLDAGPVNEPMLKMLTLAEKKLKSLSSATKLGGSMQT